MPFTYQIKRHRFAATACITFALLALTGCQVRNPERHGIEYIPLPEPQSAFVTDDGRLLLSLHIDHDLQTQYNGWRWIVIEANATAPFLKTDRENARPCNADFIYWDPDHPRPTAKMIPPPSEPGLPQPGAPPVKDQGLTPYLVTKHPRFAGVQITSMDADATSHPKRLILSPNRLIHQSTSGKLVELVDRLAMATGNIPLAIITTPIWFMPRGYEIWCYEFKKAFRAPKY